MAATTPSVPRTDPANPAALRTGAGLMTLAAVAFIGYGGIFFVRNFSGSFLELGIGPAQVDVGKAATAHLRAHPGEGRVADRAATVVLTEGLRCRGTDPVGHTVVTDMPAELGGADTGPTPGTLLRLALGSCAATTLAMRAAAEGIPLARVEVVVSSESDHRGLLGVGQVAAGPLELRLRYRLEAPGVPADRLRALVAWAERHWPVAGVTRRDLPTKVELDLAEAAAGG